MSQLITIHNPISHKRLHATLRIFMIFTIFIYIYIYTYLWSLWHLWHLMTYEGSWMRLFWDLLRLCLLLVGMLKLRSSMIFAPGCILAQFQGKIAFRVPLKIVQAIVIPKQHHQASDPPDKDIGRPSDGTFWGAFLPMFYLCSMHFFIFL